MKLLFCLSCCDIIPLSKELKTCKCGSCKGKYLEDEHHAVTNGKGINIGISNSSLFDASMKIIADFEKPISIECWARPATGIFNSFMAIDKNL